MKLKVLPFLLGILFPSVLFSQNIDQLSDGGTPWGYKFSQYDEEIPVMHMAPVDVDALIAEDAIVDPLKDRPWRFGYNHYVSYNLNNSGVWKTLDNGDKVWRLGINCPDAITINLAFKYLSIPEGAKLYVYNADKTVSLGAFTQKYVSPEDLELGTELIPGESLIIEYYVPATCTGVGSVELYRVTHGYRGAVDYARAFGDAGSCNMNVNCPDGAPWSDQKRSVVMLVSGGSGFCTGALINNTCEDAKPYVLTANHCGSSGFGSWVFRFNWESATCPNPGASPSFTSMSGSTSRASRAAADMRLVEINSAVPAGNNAYWSGWNRGSANPPSVVGIHHPSGDIKKISFDDATIATNTAMGGETNCCWDVEWDRNTTTEGGSSGSPLFDNNGRIIGQLWGGAALCTNLTGHDYYGRIFQNWNPAGSPNNGQLEFWLAPSGCGAVPTTLDGYDPNAVSLTFDAQVQSITSPNGTLCTGTHSPVIVIRNNGTTTLTSMTINYQIDGGAATGAPWTGSLASGATTNFTMPNITIATGAHTYTVTIVTGSLNGSNTDLNTTNNAMTSNYTGAGGGSSVSLPFSEGFEGGTFPPTNWTNENPNSNVGSALWVRTTTASGFGGSTACALNDQITPAATTAGQVDNLITPYLDLTTQPTPLNLTFAVANARYDANFYDSLIVWISTNCGTTWTRLASYGNNTGGNSLATAPDVTSAFVPTAAQWATKTINLNAYASQTAALIRFQLRSGWGNNTYIDNVNIQGTPTVPPTASFSVNDNSICAGQTVTYNNTSSRATTFSWTFPGGSPSSGSTSPIVVTYAAAGTYTTTLTATNSFGTNTTTQTITVNALPTVTSNSTYGTVCDNGGNLVLSGGSPAGGTYSGPGVTGTNFNPATAGVGTHNITYSFTDGNGCSNSAVGSVVVAPCSGIDLSGLENVRIYPNPTTQIIYITGLSNAEHSYSIISTVGQEIRNGVITGDGAIDLGAVATGTYYIKIDSKFWKIIKQ